MFSMNVSNFHINNTQNIYTIDKQNYHIISIGYGNKFNKYIDYITKVPGVNDNDILQYSKLNNVDNNEYCKYLQIGIMQQWTCYSHINISICANYFKLSRNLIDENNLIDNIKNNKKQIIDSNLGISNNNNFDINKPYILYHDNSINSQESLNGVINDKYLCGKNKINLTNISQKMFDIIKLIENKNNTEIHLINSIWLFIIYLLCVKYGIGKNVNIYIHQYSRKNRIDYIKNFNFPKLNNFICIDDEP